jgi:hypothetical protein
MKKDPKEIKGKEKMAKRNKLFSVIQNLKYLWEDLTLN